jgi:MSHA biogenesis protein MshG
MNKFAYRARDGRGALVAGVMEGDTREGVLSQLDSLGLIPVRVTEQREIIRSSERILAKFRRVKFDDLIFFTRQLQTVIRSGIPLLAGLEALEEQTSSRALKMAIGDVRRDIDKGQRLSDALGRHKRIFPEVYVSMVRAGEVGGSLEEVLERLSNLLEFQMRTKEMLKAAIRYPIFVISTLVSAFIVLVVFVIPRFAGFFKSLKAELPLPTRIMLFISEMVQAYGPLLLIGAVLVGVAFVLLIRSSPGALIFDRFKLRIPLMGPIILKICMSRFAAMLENLVKVGVPIVKSLEIVTKTIGNRYIGAKIAEISTNIEKGKGISKSLKETGVFPSLVLHLVATGEDTGSLEEMLKEVYYHYDREVTYSINRLSAWIEPILVAGLSLMVLFLALAIFLPWWNMMGALRGGG